MGVPLWLLRLLPMWDYICPRCEHDVPKNSHECPHCHERYPTPLKIPPKLYRDRQALEDYVHTHVFPKVSPAHREYLAQFFTELFNDGFESGDFNAWTATISYGSGNSISIDSLAHHGDYSAKAVIADPEGNYALAYKTFTSAYSDIYIRGYFRLSALPADGNGFSNFKIRSVADVYSQVYFGVYNNGGSVEFFAYDFQTDELFLTGASVSADTGYCLEGRVVRNSSAGIIQMWVDGALKIDESGLNTGSNDLDRLYVGYQHVSDFASGGVSGDFYADCVVVSDAYIGPEAEETLIEVGDSLGLSDSILRHKTLSVTDAVGTDDACLGNKTPLIVKDAVSLAGLVEAITGAIIKTVFDTVGTADVVLMDKQVAVADTIRFFDIVSTPSRVLQVLEAIGGADGSSVYKTLMIAETVSLTEVVEVGVGGVKKTRLFLILGDLAVQLTGD